MGVIQNLEKRTMDQFMKMAVTKDGRRHLEQEQAHVRECAAVIGAILDANPLPSDVAFSSRKI